MQNKFVQILLKQIFYIRALSVKTVRTERTYSTCDRKVPKALMSHLSRQTQQ